MIMAFIIDCRLASSTGQPIVPTRVVEFRNGLAPVVTITKFCAIYRYKLAGVSIAPTNHMSTKPLVSD